MLFDIGIAGPIAGFVVAVPALFIGICDVARRPRCRRTSSGVELGEPLLFKLASWLLWGRSPDGYSLNLHPMAFAAWFGLLATALNLFPIGQLDGGHISYAVLGPAIDVRHARHDRASAVVLAYFSASWIVWTGLMVGDALHVRTAPSADVFDEHVPLDRTRLLLASGRARDVRPLLHAGADRADWSCCDR